MARIVSTTKDSAKTDRAWETVASGKFTGTYINPPNAEQPDTHRVGFEMVDDDDGVYRLELTKDEAARLYARAFQVPGKIAGDILTAAMPHADPD